MSTIMVDFQDLYASVLGLRRDSETGRYPPRRPQDAFALPLAEYARQAIISGAIAQELDLVLTNSDGDSDRRNFLLQRLGPGASERIIDPGSTWWRSGCLSTEHLTQIASGPSNAGQAAWECYER